MTFKQAGAPGALGFEVCFVANTAPGELSIPQGRSCAEALVANRALRNASPQFSNIGQRSPKALALLSFLMQLVAIARPVGTPSFVSCHTPAGSHPRSYQL